MRINIKSDSPMELNDGSRVGVIGGGPSGSLVSYFLLEMAERIDQKLEIDIYEPRDYSRSGPAGCNMCGGIVSESLAQLLAVEGINLPPAVVQRGIDSYVLHSDRQTVNIRTPLEEMRIAALHRGSGPKGSRPGDWESFDKLLLDMALNKGARHRQTRVTELLRGEERPVIKAKDGSEESYDLVIGAVGVNGGGIRLFQKFFPKFRPPATTRAGITEIGLGREAIEKHFGNSIHIFLPQIPGLQFAAAIPKGDYVTLCLLGRDINSELMTQFMESPEVVDFLPSGVTAQSIACRCLPNMNVGAARNMYGDRVVLMGDCGVSRLYKDGIGAAYRAAKAAAVTAVFQGVSKKDFKKFYRPVCRQLEFDNRIGGIIFATSTLFRKLRFLREAMLRVTEREQDSDNSRMTMSMILWDIFTGSAPYRDVLMRSMAPKFALRFAGESLKALRRRPGIRDNAASS
ncbi:NAD(P)/FAD-dependent oxidoreductase [candidate division KSB1 bacterium]